MCVNIYKTTVVIDIIKIIQVIEIGIILITIIVLLKDNWEHVQSATATIADNNQPRANIFCLLLQSWQQDSSDLSRVNPFLLSFSKSFAF